MRLAKKHRFPWRKGNRFRLLVDGHTYFAAMLQAIEGARDSILLLMYLCESGQVADRFIQALVDAAGRGVRVHLLLDDFGSFLLRRPDRERLTAGGVELVFCNPLQVGLWSLNLARDHRKILVVDGETAFTGGAGLTDQFDPRLHPELFWHDVMVEVRGPCVADWRTLFQEAWERWAGHPLPVPAATPPHFPDGRPGRVSVINRSRTRIRSDIIRSLIRRIRRAGKRVWLTSPYFLPTWKLRRELRKKVLSGAEVRLLLPGHYTDNPPVRALGRRYYEKLLRDGIRIFEYQPRFLHAKIHLCDQWLSIGSANLDRWGSRWNLEANQEMDDPQLASRVQALLEEDFATSRELQYPEWLHRSWGGRLAEHFWGWILEAAVWASERRPGRRS